MITKFLYEIDENNKKTINAVIVNENKTEMLKSYPFLEKTVYKKSDEDILTLNNGELVYVVFNDNNEKKYLDVGASNSGVKISLTNNISFATPISKEMATTILYYYDYFDLEDSEFIFSGYHKGRGGRLTDKFDNFFRKANDESFCQIRKNNKVYFLSREGKNYCLNEDFSKAARIVKKDIRNIVTIFKIIDENTQKSDISFSKYNCFTDGYDYLFAGNKPVRTKFEENVLTIDTSPTNILFTDKIVNNENVYMKLKDIFINLDKPSTEELSYLKYDKHFVSKVENSYKLVTNPADATLLEEKDIKIFKAGISIYASECEFKRYSNDALFIYYTQDDIYKFVEKPEADYNSGLMVQRRVYDDYLKNFSLHSSKNSEGVIVIKDKQYLQINKLDNGNIQIKWLNSSYHATILSEELATSLVNIFKWDIQKRAIKNMINDEIDLKRFNIEYSDNEQDILVEYQKILDKINSEKHRICSFGLPSSIKFESEKGSLEYLRRFYLKGIYDTSKLFETILSNYDFVKNILIVGPGSHLNLTGLNMAASKLNKKINVSTLSPNRWGYYPKTILSNNVKYVAAYRFGFINLVESLVNSYDMILFSQGYNEDEESVELTLKSIMKNSNDIVIANLRFSNFEKQTDSIHNYFKNKFTLRRKTFNHELEVFKEGLSINKTSLENLLVNTCRCNKKTCEVPGKVVENINSYHSILVKKDFTVKDHYND